MKYIFYILIFTINLFATDYYINGTNDLKNSEISVFDENNSKKIETTKNELPQEIKRVIKQQKNIYASYKYLPEKIYKNQRFEVKIKAIITTKNFNKIETKFINSENMNVLNPQSPWLEVSEQTYENSFFFKAYDESFKLPTFQIEISKNDNIIETENLDSKDIVFSEIGKNINNFSSVIAKNLIINAQKTKQYNNDELITILDISAQESNLEDFYIKDVKEQGISKIDDNYPEQNILYYLVLPVHTKKIDFSFYNTQEKIFTTVKIPIVLENELVSTQTDLNPNKSNLLLYKKIALSISFVIFLIIYFFKRRKIYLIMTLLSLIVLLIYVMPNETKVLKKDSYIYILPTKKSTIFQKTNKDYVVEVSIKRGEFVKIIFSQGDKSMIGWVKENDLSKN